MANGKKRKKSHRSPDWRPTIKPQETRAAKRVAAIKGFPIWGAAALASNLGMLLLGGLIPVLLAVGACAMELWIIRKDIPTENKVLYCILTFIASWVLWFVLMMGYQMIFG